MLGTHPYGGDSLPVDHAVRVEHGDNLENVGLSKALGHRAGAH